MDRKKIIITECRNAVTEMRKYLIGKGVSEYDTKESTRHYYKTYKRGFQRGIELQQKIDIDKACEWIMHTPMYAKQPSQLVDEFRKAMEE